MPGDINREYWTKCLARDKDLLIYLVALLLSWYIGVVGVLCKVETSVYLGKWYIFRQDARKSKAWILEQMPRARQS